MAQLISCIMPTRNRRRYIPQAVACYLSQTWPNKELVVVDNGEDPIHDLLPPSTLYFHVGTERYSTGWMRNYACAQARGDIVCHFDDDDWSHPHRMYEQQKLMTQFQSSIVGYSSMYFIHEEKREAWLYVNQEEYALGTSFMYSKNIWKGTRFPDWNVGEDNEFFRNTKRGTLIVRNANDRMVARIHSGNTSPKMVAEDETWRRADYGAVARIMGIDQAAAA